VTAGELRLTDRTVIEELYTLFGPPRLRCVPLGLTARQEAFLMLTELEVFYGGAAGGGKSVGLLAGALQYADVPGYSALIIRKSLAELQLPGNMIDLSHDWLATSKATWNGELKQWRFPGRTRTGSGGATLTFGYLADDNDVSRYFGSSFSYLGFDELTAFPETHYRRMRRVLRQPTAINPGDPAPDGTRLADVPPRRPSPKSSTNYSQSSYYFAGVSMTELRDLQAVSDGQGPRDDPLLATQTKGCSSAQGLSQAGPRPRSFARRKSLASSSEGGHLASG
jgi:hypothetical protein